jgi:hypothetical protein
MLKWFTIGWYKYIFEKPLGEKPLKRIICRTKGHPNGVVWYNVSGTEPNMTCVDCGEDLG